MYIFGRTIYVQYEERNRVEYAAEDYDWQRACTEERMYRDSDTNELVHPIHLESGRYIFGTGGRVVRNQLCAL
jgi:hypothetical protein